MTDILQWFLIALSIPLVVLLVLHTMRRARELDQRIDEFHAEQEAATNQPGPINPYEQMAGLFEPPSDPTPDTQHPTPGSAP